MRSSSQFIHSVSSTIQTDSSKMKGNEQILRKLPPSAYLESLNIKKMKSLGNKTQEGSASTQQSDDTQKKKPLVPRPSANFLARAQKLQSAINFYEPQRISSTSTVVRNNPDKFPKLGMSFDHTPKAKSRSRPTPPFKSAGPRGSSHAANFSRESSDVVPPAKRPLHEQSRHNFSPYKKPQLPAIGNQTTRARSKQLRSTESKDIKKTSTKDEVRRTPATRSRPSQASSKEKENPSESRGLSSVATQPFTKPRSRQSPMNNKETSREVNVPSLQAKRPYSSQTFKDKVNTDVGFIHRPHSRQISRDDKEPPAPKKRVTFTRTSAKGSLEKVGNENNGRKGLEGPASAAQSNGQDVVHRTPLSDQKTCGNAKSATSSLEDAVPTAEAPADETSAVVPLPQSPRKEENQGKVSEKPKKPPSRPTSAKSSSRPGTSGSIRSSRPTSASSARMPTANCGFNFSAILAQTLKLTEVSKKLKGAGDGPENMRTDNIDNLPFLLPSSSSSKLGPAGAISTGAEGDAFNPPVNTPVSPKSPTSDSTIDANESSSQEDCCRKDFGIEDDNDLCGGIHVSDKDNESSIHDFVTDYLQIESMKEVNHITQAIARAKICRMIKGADPNLTLEKLKAAKSHYLQLPCFADAKFFTRIHIPPHIFMNGKSLDRDLLTLQYLQNKMDNLYQKNLKSFDEKRYRRMRLPPITEESSSPSSSHRQSGDQSSQTVTRTADADSAATIPKDGYLHSFHKLFQSVQLPQWAKECFGSASASEEEEEEGYVTTSTEEEVQVPKANPERVAERVAVAQKILQMFENNNTSKTYSDDSRDALETKQKQLADSEALSKDYDEDASSDNPSEPP